MAITSGPIWGQAEWGVAWDWTDVRIYTFGLLTALSAYLVVARRSQPDGDDARDTFSAVGLFGFALVPLTYMATRWWQERHPGPVIGGGEGRGVDSVILQIWLLAFLGMTIQMIGQAMVSWEVQKCERHLAELQQRMD